MKFILPFFSGGLIFIFTFVGIAGASEKEISETKAINIAKNQLRKFSYDLKQFGTKSEKFDTPYSPYFPSEYEIESLSDPADIEYVLERINLLKDKVYWIVDFHRIPLGLDGGFSFFIDAKTGEILLIRTMEDIPFPNEKKL